MRVVGAGVAGEVGAGGAPLPRRPRPPNQGSLRRRKLQRPTSYLTSPLRGRVVAAVVVAGVAKSPQRRLMTRWIPLSGSASPAGKMPAMRSPASTGRLEWRPNGSGDAKVVRQAVVVRRY
jgi:hypothetical protein